MDRGERVTLEQLPQEVVMLRKEVKELKELILQIQPIKAGADTDNFLTIEKACDYLELTKATVYTKVSRGELPVMKRGKRLMFLKHELANYIKQGRKKTNAEIEAESKAYLSENRREGKKWN